MRTLIKKFLSTISELERSIASLDSEYAVNSLKQRGFVTNEVAEEEQETEQQVVSMQKAAPQPTNPAKKAQGVI